MRRYLRPWNPGRCPARATARGKPVARRVLREPVTVFALRHAATMSTKSRRQLELVREVLVVLVVLVSLGAAVLLLV